MPSLQQTLYLQLAFRRIEGRLLGEDRERFANMARFSKTVYPAHPPRGILRICSRIGGKDALSFIQITKSLGQPAAELRRLDMVGMMLFQQRKTGLCCFELRSPQQ